MAYRFKLKAGMHEDENGRYEVGDIITTDTDLAKKFGRDKFELLGGGPTPTAKASASATAEEVAEESVEGESRETFEAMTIADLKEYAADNEIDISGATRKEEIIDKIVESMEG